MIDKHSADAFALEQPTPEQLRQRAFMAEQAKKEEAKRKSFVPPPSEFKLVGSNRAADQEKEQGVLF